MGTLLGATTYHYRRFERVFYEFYWVMLEFEPQLCAVGFVKTAWVPFLGYVLEEGSRFQ